jgi:putative (di)nucleoside polyphosphate hydrolase
VCAVLTGPQPGRVLVFRRADGAFGESGWQFPQGGVKPGETALEALRRELLEETGTDRIEVVRQAPSPIRYDYPPEVAEKLSRGKPDKRGFAGQEQTWFLVKLLDGEGSLRFDGPSPEFDAFRWVSPRDAIEQVVPFKAEAYREGLTALGLLG